MMLHQQHQSNPLKPRNQLFTCLACQVAFPSSERQRTHYRSDWHKYNLKRKIAQLAPINAEQFAQKVLAQQTKGREEEERQGVVYECSLCRKSYSSENSFANHLSSKKHKDTESILGKEHLASPVIQPHHHKMSLFSDADDTDNESVLSFVTETDRVLDTCLFCGLYSGDFESSLDHMKLFHGFFLPDIEYLEDPKGLVMYLSEKIVNDFTCLYCNGRGKEWKSLFAVRKHMLDKGHCKMAYDESEDPEELLKFYDFEPLGDEIATHMDENQDLVLLNTGTRLGHRQFMRYYKQRPRKPSTASSEPKLPAIEPRNRKERRQITFGTSVNHVPITTKPQEFASRQRDFASSHRNNLVATNRLRVQNTI